MVETAEATASNPPTGRTTVRLVVVPHHSRADDHFCLVTNREVTRDLAQQLAEAYRRRWGIETSHRKVTEFLPKTSSPTFSVAVSDRQIAGQVVLNPVPT